MGCWGMGMTQSDEFCEHYDNFMEEYDNGRAVSAITAGILARYHAEFDDDDGIMHDVYFALAKAEWMCCEQSELVLNRVKEIIDSGSNITFYRELEATEKDLIVRQKNLEKFLEMLKTPRETPRKRKRTAPAVEKTFPPLEIGDCFAYRFDGGYRVMCILERFKMKAKKEQVTVAIFDGVYSAKELNTTDFRQAVMGKMFTVIADDFLGASVIKKVAHIPVNLKNRERLLGVDAYLNGEKSTFRMEIKKSLGISLHELLYYCEENTPALVDRLEIGGCYAYPYQDGYKFAVVLDRVQRDETDGVLIVVLSASSKTPKINLLRAKVSSCTVYDKDALPNLHDWIKVTSIKVPHNMQKQLFGNSRYIISGIFDFLQDRSPHQERPHALMSVLRMTKAGKSAFELFEIDGYYSIKEAGENSPLIVIDLNPIV